jgi:hypothetical protein
MISSPQSARHSGNRACILVAAGSCQNIFVIEASSFTTCEVQWDAVHA